jgi:DNA-binding response OmpR family regulator
MAKRIIVCDDDEGILDVTKIILEDIGYEVDTMVDCDNLITILERRQPAVILLDLWMPNTGGESITREIKKNKKLKKIPIIIVSASKDTEKVAFDAGADGFICKPFDIEELETLVKKFAKED